MKVTLREIRERTYKPTDAWWTVLLVDPLASRLVRLVAPHRWITPNILTVLATVIGLGAAATFWQGTRWWLVTGALLFHVSFVVDCMDGKIARLNGTGSVFGAWLDYVFDRIRVLACGLGLMAGQYVRTGDNVYLYLMTLVVFLDMFRYLNALEMANVRRGMKEKVVDLRQEVTLVKVADRTVTPEEAVLVPVGEAPAGPLSAKRRLGLWLRAHRIRTHLFSGIEYHMGVFIVGPLTGWVVPVTLASAAGLIAFEGFLIYKLWRTTRAYPGKLHEAQAEHEAFFAQRVEPGRTVINI